MRTASARLDQARPAARDARVLILGGARVGRSLSSALSVVLFPQKVLHLQDERELTLELQRNAIGPGEPDIVVALMNEYEGHLAQRMFDLHSRLRSRFDHAGRTETWNGGLIGIARRVEVDELAGHPLFSNMGGHLCVEFPLRLIDVIDAIHNVGKLYPRAWAHAIAQSGLADFWRHIADSQTGLGIADLAGAEASLSLALAELLEKNRLRYLLPHAHVVAEIRKLRQRLTAIAAEPVARESSLAALVSEAANVMAAYRIGGDRQR